MNCLDNPIGFFDSGVGGISVMREAVKLLPHEDFIYYGDSLNAPYGIKNISEVRNLTLKAVEFLVSKKVKAIVIACNTATSAAINELRRTYKDIPFVGIEPALKPAVEINKSGKIIIMATPMTLSELKFKNLLKKYVKKADIVTLPCAGLVEYIENGILDGEEIHDYLNEKFIPFNKDSIKAVVLGCTHYPFIKSALQETILSENTLIIDGSFGTAMQLKRMLIKNKILRAENEKQSICIYNSLQRDSIIELSKRLLTY